jgi:pimeloyl-[acyl-carrier protein] methyl ester esterase
MSSLVFVPGWGLDTTFWQPVQNLLGGLICKPFFSHSIAIHSLGHLENKSIAVGHSLGFAWLLHYFPGCWKGLVSVNGFTKFTRTTEFPEGIAPRVLQKMIAQFSQDPGQVYTEFLRRCGNDASFFPSGDLGELLRGLHALQEWDERETLHAQNIPVLALAGLHDPIVTPNLTRKCFANIQIQWQAGGHLLPHTHSIWCATQIQSFAERI